MKLRLSSVLLFISLPFLTFAKNHIPKSIYDFKVTGLDGKVIDFSKFKGKKILIVNTTSVMNHNFQYAELEALQQKYKNKLIIVGFLTNDCSMPPRHRGAKLTTHVDPKDYDVTFPLTKLVDVRGEDSVRTPVYIWLTHKKYNHFKDTYVDWDFQKYLLNEKGKLIAEFDSDVSVSDPNVIAAIKQ